VAEYNLRFRNPRTLAWLGEMPRYKSAIWTRRPVLAGSFSLAVHKDDIAAAVIPEGAIFEVLRDNTFEFAGVLEQPEYDAITQMWKLSGPDLKGFWLKTREINPGASEFDAQLGIAAQTAMIHYVTDHLTAPTDSDRDVNGELTGIDFTCRGTAGLGSTVYKNARWENLLSVLAELALEGDLIHDVVLKPYHTGYEYQVSAPTDATEDGGGTPVVFSVSRDNVGEAVYVRDMRRIVNACYALGSGTGAARTVREVKDTTSVTNDFRREGHVDARAAGADSDRLDMAGNGVISQSLLNAQTARMSPLNIEPTLYRRDWDIGYDVTVDFNVIGVQVDKRIEEVRVVLERGEKVQVSLGAQAQTLPRRAAAALHDAGQSQVE
jgi:hypothetical protein